MPATAPQIQEYDAPRQAAPVDRHLDILFGGIAFGDVPFAALYRECLAETGTDVPEWKLFRRAQRALNLARYFDYSLGVEGARGECGVFRGFSALLACRLAALRDPGFTGAGLHFVDSFEGLSPPTIEDAVGTEIVNGRKVAVSSHGAGHFAVPLDHVQGVLGAYPDAQTHKGWIPEVFAALPEARWSFVHIDVDLHAPTLAALEYFYPRLAPGGVIVNDDYDSPLFPGGKGSWETFCTAHGVPFIALDSGQAVILRS